MKILAFDSAAKIASVALCEDERLLALYNINNGLTQSELLMPMIEHAVKTLSLDYSDIDVFATSTGPGSFTGVRIGAALLKGMAFARDKACVSVSTLEALAENLAGLPGIIVSVMDARRGEVYNANFSSDGKALTRLTEDRAISIEALAKELASFECPIYLVGDGYQLAERKLSELGINLRKTPLLLQNENAYSIAKIAFKKYKDGEILTDSEIMPSYLRLPQAERERLERLKEVNEK